MSKVKDKDYLPPVVPSSSARGGDTWWWSRYDYTAKKGSYDVSQGSRSWRKSLRSDVDDDFIFGWGGHGVSGGSEDEEASKLSMKSRRSFQRGLGLLQGSSNVINGDKVFKVSWSDGKKQNEGGSTLYLSPDGLVSKDGVMSDEALDGLTGKVYLASTLRNTVDSDVWKSAQALRNQEDRTEVDEASLRLWEAMETSIARSDILRDWGGFAPYLAQDELQTLSTKRHVQNYLNREEPSVTAASVGVAWNLLHPGDRVKMPDIYDPILDVVAKELETEIPSSSRLSVAERISLRMEEILRKAKEKPTPPPPPPGGGGEGEGEGGGEGEGKAAGEGAGGGEGAGEEASSSKPKKKTRKKKLPKVTDSTQFGEKVSNNEGKELSSQESGAPGSDASVSEAFRPDLDAQKTYVKLMPTTSPEEYQPELRELRHGIAAIRKSLAFLSTDVKMHTYGHRSGDVDDGSLYKLSMDDDRIMSRPEILSTKDLAICLVVDESGSMGRSSRYVYARQVAITLVEGLSGIPGITVDVYGHSAQDYEDGCFRGGAIVYEYVSPRSRDPKSLMHISGRCENLDGYAIQSIATRFAADHRHASHKIMFVISDGEPSGNGYRGSPAYDHTARVCAAVQAKLDVDVYGIGVDDAYDQYRAEMLFGKGRAVVLKDVASSAPLMVRFVRQVAASMKRSAS